MTQPKQSDDHLTAAEFDAELRSYLNELGAEVDADAPVHAVLGHVCYKSGGTWFVAFLLALSDDEGIHKTEPFKCVGILPAHVVFDIGQSILEDIHETGDDPVAYLQSHGIEAQDASELDSDNPKGQTLQ